MIANPAHAAWAGMTDQELINQSDLIVKATFIGKTIVKFHGLPKKSLLGVLKVEHVYKGDPADVVLLSFPLRPPNVSVSTDILHKVGQNGLWFLRSYDESEGIYLADHPQRIWSLDQQAKLMQLLSSTAQ
jgi:hypothetical protein